MNNAQISRIAIWAALLATLYLTFESSGQSGDDLAISAPVRTAPLASVAAVEESQAPSALPLRHWNEEAANDPFQTMTWYVPPKPQAARPSRPQAPPVPYKYFGKMMEGDVPHAFLYQGDKVVVVKVGDVLASQYRVENIAPENVSIIYLPLDTRQIVPLGESAPELAVADSDGDDEAAAENKTAKAATGPINVQAIQEMVRQSTLRVKEKGENANNE
jgi:Tfp pilus assembly protein PilP